MVRPPSFNKTIIIIIKPQWNENLLPFAEYLKSFASSLQWEKIEKFREKIKQSEGERQKKGRDLVNTYFYYQIK